MKFKTAIIEGSIQDDLTKIIQKKYRTKSHNRPIAQMRSDWYDERILGITSKEKLSTIPYIEASSVKEFTGLSFKSEKDGFRVLFKNSLDVPLKNLVIYGHYEYPLGKTTAHYVDKEIGKLNVGKSVSEIFNKTIEINALDRKFNGDLHNIVITGKGDSLSLNIKIPIK